MSHTPVIGIDFGATYTKIAYREKFGGTIQWGELESRESTAFGSYEDQLIPSLAVETGRENRPWLFGQEAAAIRPGGKVRVHHNWKSRLLKPDGSAPDPKSLQIAIEFFGWLRWSLADSNEIPFEIDEATIRLCVPAFDHSGAILSQLALAIQQAGWTNKLILKTSEPKANTIGYCTRGRNIRMRNGIPDWKEMFDENSPFVRFTHFSALHLTGNEQGALAVIDVGSFTSDLSVVYWNVGTPDDYLNEGEQISFAHGIVDDLDAQCLHQILDDAGETWNDLDFDERERVKVSLYSNNSCEVSGINIGGPDVQRAISTAIDQFTEKLIELLDPHVKNTPINWFLLTGGGSRIPRISEKLTEYFRSIRMDGGRPSRLPGNDSGNRLDTALGATSIILEHRRNYPAGARPALPLSEPPPLPPLENCPCQGINPNCMRCGGSGILDESQQPSRTPHQVHPGAVLPIVAEPVLVEEETVTEDLGNTLDFINSDDPAPRVFAPEQIKQHTLEGWMGDLVFPSHPKNYADYRKALRSDDTEQQNAAWYRLLCFGCTLGARVSRQTIRNFWSTTLNRTNFWEITTGGSLDQKKLDQFFEELIHREFNSVYAEGEQAELLRRVFYDFRKLHHLVYFNDFPNVVLQILDDTDHGADPIKFLRSGWLPDGTRWKGVIGQSMTSPLLFLMREWRRMGLIATDKHDHHCFYMNSPAARAAIRKGWLDWNRYGRGDLQSILNSSRTVHEHVRTTGAWSIMDFDIPLQILGTP